MRIVSALRGRLAKSYSAVRTAIPDALLPAVVGLRTALARRSPAQWKFARNNMRFLLDKTRPDADIDDAARRWLRSTYWRNERRYRPHLITSQPVEGIERVLAARDTSRGLVLTLCHHANWDGSFAALANAGLPTIVTGAPFLFREDTPDFLRQHVKLCELSGSPMLDLSGGYAAIAKALENGQALAIAVDIPGSTPIEFAGHRVLGSYGAARGAYEFNAQVVVCTYHRDPHAVARIRLELLEPKDFPDGKALLTEIMRRHEESIVDWPEALDIPLFRFGVASEEHEALLVEAGFSASDVSMTRL